MGQAIKLSISEAAKFFGVSEKTIRRAIRSHEIVYMVMDNRYKITLESLIKWSEKKINIKNKNKKGGIGQYVEKWKINT